MVKLRDRVRLYEGAWFIEGRVIKLDGNLVDVDFNDWIQQYPAADLVERFRDLQIFWEPTSAGVRVATY